MKINNAERKLKKGDKKKDEKTKGVKRVWLPEVDYKHGGLKKDNIRKKNELKKAKKQKRQNKEEPDDDDDDFDDDESV